MEVNIIEGKRLIAEFMGAIISLNKQYVDMRKMEGQVSSSISRMNYHTSWDWQIPAWSKVAKAIKEGIKDNIGTEFSIYMGLVNRYESAVFNNIPSDGFVVITDAIHWYNALTPQQVNKQL